MATLKSFLLCALLIYQCFHCEAVDLLKGTKGGGGGKKSLVSTVKGSVSCLAPYVALPGAHYSENGIVPGKGLMKKNEASGGHTINIIGKVDTVLRGGMGSQKEWDVKSCGAAGIGAATLDKWSAVGEAVFINGMAIIRPSDNVSDEYYHTRTSDKFRTQFSAFVTHDAKPDGVFTVNYPLDVEKLKVPLVNFPMNGSMFMTDFYSRLYTAVGKHPFCYSGLADFGSLEAIALSAAPTRGEPLFGDNKKKYYAKPVEKLPLSNAFIIGCAANYMDLEDNPKLEEKMKMLLYKNPFDTGRPKTEFHGHAVTLKRCITSLDQIKAEDIGEAFHMVNTARIKVAKVNVYVLKDASQLVSISE